MDLARPFKPQSLGGAKYNFVLVDEATRFSWSYGLNKKYDVEVKLKE